MTFMWTCSTTCAVLHILEGFTVLQVPLHAWQHHGLKKQKSPLLTFPTIKTSCPCSSNVFCFFYQACAAQTCECVDTLSFATKLSTTALTKLFCWTHLQQSMRPCVLIEDTAKVWVQLNHVFKNHPPPNHNEGIWDMHFPQLKTPLPLRYFLYLNKWD